jgi:hypothetical protein
MELLVFKYNVWNNYKPKNKMNTAPPPPPLDKLEKIYLAFS